MLYIFAARPNFMKAAPVLTELRAREGENDVVRFSPFVVHTGQHYDAGLSDVLFEQFALPCPDRNLGLGSGSHAVQTAEVMRALEPVVLEQRPDLALVFGGVNSTLAAALVAAKLGVPLGHVEAGLRRRRRSASSASPPASTPA